MILRCNRAIFEKWGFPEGGRLNDSNHDDTPDEADATPLEIDGVLDLHMFPPDQVKDLVREYLEVCLEEGIFEVRIIHGKGIGVLRTIVYSILETHPAVESYAHPSDGGSWGATVVKLNPDRPGSP